MELKGCQEGKATPKLTEIKCPQCGDCIEVFVRMGGGVGQTGRVVSDEKCLSCGYVVETGRAATEFELY